MNIDFAIRLTEILLAIAFIQQSVEHFFGVKDERLLFLVKLVLSFLLLFGFATKWVCILLFINAVLALIKFQGPYNGGSDRMGLLILSCLCLIHLVPSLGKYIFGYLALQLILSYFLPGFFKVINPKWWTGQVLQELLRFSGFPATEALRKWAEYPRLLCLVSWLIILFELFFPLTLLSQKLLILGLCLAMIFHLANTYIFGFNRFFWVWLAAYPSVLWLQAQLFIK